MKTPCALLLASALLAAPLVHAEDEQCTTVKLADPGWSDSAVTNGVASFLLDSLGYRARVDNLAVPIIYSGLRDGQVDAFLGNWMPAQQSYHQRFVQSGQVSQLVKNLDQTRFTLAVPQYVWDAGVHDFADLAKYAERFDQKIYGIGAGAPANQSIQRMITDRQFGLGDWKLVESNEQAMLAEVNRAVKRQRWIVFLGWTPHPMNVQLDMHYLTGGEQYFGEAGRVYTLTRNGFAEQCPNAGRLLSNLQFGLPMENALMTELLKRRETPGAVVKAWIKANPQVLERWLAGVTTRDGQDALSAVNGQL